nr:AraC family transcriptional regulator [uncultured Enterobacter sp.]
MTTRHIDQRFWRSPVVPYAELRSTWRSLQAYKLHSHAQLSVGAIVEGETQTLCDGELYSLRVGDVVLIAPEVAHSCNPLGGARSYHMLYLDRDWCLAQLGLTQGQLHCQQTVVRDENVFSRFTELVSLMHANDMARVPSRLEALFAALPGIFATSTPSHADCSTQLLERFHADLQMPPTLDQLASAFAIRKETLIRHVRLATGMTPGALLNNLRVEFAKTRLRAGEGITDVGYQSGFADQSHFHRTFVRYTASTPRQYAQPEGSISDNN